MPNPIVNCPALEDYIAGDQCLENLAGMGEVIYAFERKLLKAALSRTNETYTLPAEPFKTGGRLYKFECKRESQQVQGESQGPRKGFNITLNMIIEAVDATSARIARALNNLDMAFLIPGDNETQILYDPYKKVQIESGGLTSDTGAAAGDDRQTSIALTLGPVAYPNLFVDISAVEGGLDSLMTPAE